LLRALAITTERNAMDKTTCIVVGAGPAGAACAFVLAKKGIDTVLLERGREPGDKNVAAFVMFPGVLEHLIPDFAKDVPMERNIVRTDQVLLGERDVKLLTSFNYERLEHPLSFSAFRGSFDPWFAQKAADAGAHLVTGMRVSDLIMDGSRVAGVEVDGEELCADVVVGADGYHSTVGEKAGLIRERSPDKCALGVKEVLDLPPEIIEERFQLSEGIGCEMGIFGYHLNGLGFTAATVYTNTDSIGMAAYATVGELARKGIKLHEQLEQLKRHPYLRHLIRGATLREYSAHIISHGGEVEPHRLYGDGVLLAGEAAGTMQAGTGMGVPVCMLSGMMAAETVADAVKKRDFSARTLKSYLKYLHSTTLLDMVRQSRKTSAYLAGKGATEVPHYMKAAADTFNENWESEVDYISKESHPLLRKLYSRIGQNFVPRLIRWPINAAIGISNLRTNLVEKIRRKVRSHYYAWKEQPYS
jgi:electron transfer flavoprotein-quinone oxidoreductase